MSTSRHSRGQARNWVASADQLFDLLKTPMANWAEKGVPRRARRRLREFADFFEGVAGWAVVVDVLLWIVTLLLEAGLLGAGVAAFAAVLNWISGLLLVIWLAAQVAKALGGETEPTLAA